MKSIEKLREFCSDDSCYVPCARIQEYADEIEREIAERYMELPVDADDVPIRVGDMVCLRHGEPFEVGGVRDTRNQWHIFPYDLQRWYSPLDLHHYHAPTVEDVLREFDVESTEIHTVEKFNELIAKYADKLREVLRDEL